MTEERKQSIRELQGLSRTAYIAVSNIIQHINDNGLAGELDDNWNCGMLNLRDAESTFGNLTQLAGFRLEGLSGDELDEAMFEVD